MSKKLVDGDSFLFPLYAGQNREHLWVVLTTPDADHQCAIVSISTLRDYSDTTTILNAGEHEFIRHKSFVFYAKAKLIYANEFEQQFVDGFAKMSSKMNRGTLNRIKEGVFESKFTPNKVKRFCQGSIRLD